ncbi:hypothetical protein F8M41_005921 [Gigaspora margarita]|uniref:Uncharacterized protein n=1 Tax=Gigaspora margarita TaxID=4874 RepID=A0A8H3X7B0_GIGMA|nr:hypothetical protein F8M41_005921 [Gigaspora margarita]
MKESDDLNIAKDSIEQCIKLFSDCIQLKTDESVIKSHIKNIIKFRLEFLDLAEKSVDHCTKLLCYIVNLKAVISFIDDKTIHEENIIEELKSLSNETKDYEANLQALSEQIMKIINEFLNINDDFKSHIDKIKLKEAKKRFGITQPYQIIPDIAVSLTKFKLYWDEQRTTLSRILRNINNTGKGNRVNRLNIKVIGHLLENLKSSIFYYNYAISGTLTYEKMINTSF